MKYKNKYSKENPIKFNVVNELPSTIDHYPSAYLLIDNWDDWFEFSTMYLLVVYNDEGVKTTVGPVKIGEFNMARDQRRPNIPKSFEKLENTFFSLGQDESYYEKISSFPETLQNELLTGLHDIVFEKDLREKAYKEKVTRVSLLRTVSTKSIEGQFSRILEGGKRLTDFNFQYKYPKYKGTGPTLTFEVTHDSNPPTNIHVIIGRNGVGKTHLLNNMTTALIDKEAKAYRVGEFVSDRNDEPFAGLVSVTFSAFDKFEPLSEKKDKVENFRYSYIGLKRTTNIGGERGTPKSPEMLAKEFEKSLIACTKSKSKREQFVKAIDKLKNDSVFSDANITSLLDEPENATKLFSKKLSSGHKIVLLTITRLIETVEEKTLVLLDEPEAHLHPPLLSAFIRALSDLLIFKNGVAIIATHSPVIVQEVPKTCVWNIRRSGALVEADRLPNETFGENVGTLTRAVFGLEVEKSGYHDLIQKAVDEADTVEEVIAHFNNQLGWEAQAVARALFNVKESNQGKV